ncbi:hypothetical protein G7046_g3578 [Stylonectria norvegica]|nr:hypothetical protein G7046_g3578 [Stylonectria norvegica]
MLFSSTIVAWALCAVSVVTAQTPYPINGVKVGSTNGGAPLRKNINDLQAAGGPQWDLYLRSLARMYKLDPTDELSFFQIAGIHGKPYVQWNSAGPRKVGNNDWNGYCPHGEDLFLPWHRPYVLLFEERLVAIAVAMAAEYPSAYRAQYLAAAQTLRAPFWDWASTPAVPPATVPSKMSVKVPKGTTGLQTIQIDNPLYTFKFPKSALSGQFGTFDQQNRAQIYRCTSPQSYPSSANGLLAKESYKQWVYDAFTYSTTFKQFASTASSGVSLEQIHNAVHWDGACGGQFLDADFAAYDPLFMMHHCNVDRLWTYWQFIRPTESLFTGSYAGGSRYSTPDGTSINTGSPLSPFFSAPGKLHTPTSVVSIKPFGYTYQGLEYWKKSAAQLKTDATALINQLYATNNLKPQNSRRDNEDPNNQTRYFVQVQVNVEELERPAAVTLSIDNNSVGRLIVLKQPQTGLVNGEFALDTVTNAIELTADSTQDVVNAVLARLRVEISKHDGTIIPLTSVPSLKLQLTNVNVIPPETDKDLPVYTDPHKQTAPKKQKNPPRT